MANTFVPISKTVLSSNQATITFSSIPQTYNDLRLVMDARATGGVEYATISFQINGATPTSTYCRILFNASTTAGSRGSGQYAAVINGSSTSSSYMGATDIYIPNYTNTSYNKIFAFISSQPYNTTTANTQNVYFSTNLFQDTSAISSIAITTQGSFETGSRFDLYGIKNT